MRSTFLLIVTAVIVAAFVAYWSTYSVRFTEVAVVTTFGKAGDGSLRAEPGLYPKWPYPVQSVTKYDTRARFLQTRGETQLTADQRQIIVESFITWRVKDPLVFYQRFSSQGPEARDHFRAAERTLEALLRSALAEVGGYELRQLFDPTPGSSKLADLERRIGDRLSKPDPTTGQQLADYGIETVLVGLNRVLLPQETTKQVFERMKAARETLAATAQSQGEAVAKTITNQADSDSRRILAFANRRADEIRVAGDREAARYIAAYNEAPDLAIFLKTMDFMRRGFGKRSTLVLPTDMPGLRAFDPKNIPEDGSLPAFSSPKPAAKHDEKTAPATAPAPAQGRTP